MGVCMVHPVKVKILLLLYRNEELRFTDIMKAVDINSTKTTFHINAMRKLNILTNGSGHYRLTDTGRFIAIIIDNIWIDYYSEEELKNESKN